MTHIEKYLEHLDSIFKQEPEFYSNESLIEGTQGVSSILYRDYPDVGYITALTYGLSLVNHPEWKMGRPELCITVESTNTDWGIVAGFIANSLRGKCPFCYGETINFGEKVSDDSEMDAFLIFAPTILDKTEYLNIDIGTEYKINIAGLHPIYSDEIKVYNEIGLKDFWFHPNFEAFTINREKVF